MPEEGNIQVKVMSQLLTSVTEVSRVAEMGAKGEAVRLEQISLSIAPAFGELDISLAVGLSSNPVHLTSVLNALGIMSDPAIYGVLSTMGGFFAGGSQSLHRTISMDLKGIIRPRRQILLWAYASGDSSVVLGRVEILYRPIQLGKVDLDALNLKYGKYRRSA